MAKNKENWLLHFNELKAHIMEHHRLPQKTVVEGRSKLHWWKYQQKKRKVGLLTEEQMRMLDELEQYRSREHTGGRRKKETLPVPPLKGRGVKVSDKMA